MWQVVLSFGVGRNLPMVVVKDVPDSTMHGHIGYDIPEHEVNRCLKPYWKVLIFRS